MKETLEHFTDELDLDEWVPPATAEDSSDDDEDNNEATPVNRPAVLVKAKKDIVKVIYRPDIFKYHQFIPNQTVIKSTMDTNMSRCRKKLREALDDCGSLQHQQFMIHNLLTKGDKAGIGLGLGMMKSPIRDEATAKETILRIDDFLHSERVLGRQTNDSMAFQNTAFLLLGPTAPKDDATEEQTKAHDQALRDFGNLFSLPKTARRRLREMSYVRHDILAGTGDGESLVQTYKRSSHSLVNDENKAAVKLWCETKCDLVSASPNHKDSVLVRDKDGKPLTNEEGEKTGERERVYVYKYGKGHLFQDFCKTEEEGGCPIARDDDGDLVMGRTTFESLLPRNLKLMNKTHKQMCGCKE
ncbi:MAG: hypothetical protein ACRCZI_10920, partial [Cetobacterium sp.]